MRKALILTIAALIGFGCSSMPTGSDAGPDLAKELAANAGGPKSGDSSASTGETTIPSAIAVPWGGSTANSNSMTAKYSPTQANSNSGPTVTGFVQGITAEQSAGAQEAIDRAVEKSPVLASLAAELAELAAIPAESRDDAWAARTDTVRASYSEAFDHLVEALKRAGVVSSLDLGSLRYLTVVSVIRMNAGQTERAPSDEEVKNLARVLSNPISAARGETVVLGEGESTSDGGN